MAGRTRLVLRLLRLVGVWLLVACAAAAACRDAPATRDTAPAAGPSASSAAAPAAESAAPAPDRGAASRAAAPAGAARRDLDADERCGGHTLSRHVGWTDEQLARRLREQRDIAAASTYTDRDTAEVTIAAALTDDAARVRRWTARQGRRPNLTVRHHVSGREPIGRSLRRGAAAPEPCFDALVVLRWREDLDDFCVLTSYPEVRR